MIPTFIFFWAYLPFWPLLIISVNEVKVNRKHLQLDEVENERMEDKK